MLFATHCLPAIRLPIIILAGVHRSSQPWLQPSKPSLPAIAVRHHDRLAGVERGHRGEGESLLGGIACVQRCGADQEASAVLEKHACVFAPGASVSMRICLKWWDCICHRRLHYLLDGLHAAIIRCRCSQSANFVHDLHTANRDAVDSASDVCLAAGGIVWSRRGLEYCACD